jgi:uncharacterized protein (DUF1330 family)
VARREWEDVEVKKLIELYPYLQNEDLSIILDRSVCSIQHKASKIGLTKNKDVNWLIRSKSKSGEKAGNWKGGRKKTKKGYVLILNKSHPNADVAGYIMEHRVIMEKFLGRYLACDEMVHHKNGIKDDNSIENLELMTWSEHTVMHHTGKKRSKETCKKISESKRKRLS